MKYFVIFYLIFIQELCLAQGSFVYRKVPEKFLPTDIELQSYRLRAEELLNEAYDLTRSLPKDYARNGTVDYTSYLQNGINLHKVVVLPDFPILINPHGLSLNNDNILIFQSGSKLIMQPNDKVSYGLLKIYNVRNITIYFPKLEGERDLHKSARGEWGMGIFIKGASNVQIINPSITNCWGDGIYIGHGKTISDSINIYYPIIDNCRRNAISIVSAKNVLIESPVISNTNGSNPASGIDIEPNSNDDIINNIKINSPVTFNSQKFGIILSLERLRGKQRKDVNIEIAKPIDQHSLSGFIMLKNKRKFSNKAKIDGEIIITNPSWEETKYTKDIQSNLLSPRIIIKHNVK